MNRDHHNGRGDRVVDNRPPRRHGRPGPPIASAELSPAAIIGDKLAVRNHGDSPGTVYFEGTIKFRPDHSPKTFDFTGKNRSSESVEMLGIYAFEETDLVLRFRLREVSESGKPSRSDSFKIVPGPTAGYLVHLRRAKE
jgi:uncharacterized protein (TIGR03067 family)